MLKEIKSSDLETIAKWRNNPDILLNLFSYLPISIDRQLQWFSDYLKDSTQLIFRIENSVLELIGTIGLLDIDYKNQKAELTIIIGNEKYHGKGYGFKYLTELLNFAFDEMNLHKIKASVFSDNIPAIELYKKCGFIYEGTFQKEIFKNGTFKNVETYSKFRDY